MTPDERDLSYVYRWSIVRTLRRQSVAEHAYWVARLVEKVAPKMGLKLTAELLTAALHHDDNEIHSGDIPTPYKRIAKIPSTVVPMLSKEERQCLKICDMLEGVLFLIEEERLGNQTVGPLAGECGEELGKMVEPLGLALWISTVLEEHTNYKGRTE